MDDLIRPSTRRIQLWTIRNCLSGWTTPLLTPTAAWDQIQKLCDEGLTFGTASICIPPRYVSRAAGYVGQRLKICTVVGFPNGYNTPEVKVFETEDSIRNGADEIDMVMDLGLAKAGDWEGVLAEIRAVKASCSGHILKVIVEACQLTQEEKIAACRIVSISGADFIKTSTGFSTGGATRGGREALPGTDQPRCAHQ